MREVMFVLIRVTCKPAKFTHYKSLECWVTFESYLISYKVFNVSNEID